MDRTTFKARWLFPEDGLPIKDGLLTVVAGRIERIGPDASNEVAEIGQGDVRDLGNVALIPALVNAHTHLEFSSLREPIPRGDGSFADWIRAVLQQRSKPAGSVNAIDRGLQECRNTGVGYVGEIATSADLPPAMIHSTLGGIRFLELIGTNAEMRDECLRSAREFLDSATASDRWTNGLSPHAPYTTSLDLVAQAVSIANEFNAPISMHLAETREELEFLASQTGSLRALLDERSLFDSTSFSPGTRPMDFLERLAKASQCLIIHGNYLNDEELRFLAARADRMALVYCPRTHSYFKHDEYPLARALDLGVRVAIGTDSRASNPDLSLFEELKHAAKKHPNVQPIQLLEAATNKASFGPSAGLRVGERASVTAVRLPCNSRANECYELLFSNDSRAIAFDLS